MKFQTPLISFFSLILLCTGCSREPVLTIHMVGDSTMADKPDPGNNPERGWGQLFHTVFEEGVVIHNHARNGRSTKSFIEEGLWQKVIDSISPGDYVFIQFGHNDEKIADPKRYTNPYTGYRRNLGRYVRESRSAGATPVLLSPVVRRKFNGEGVLEDTHGAYPHVMRDLAHELQVPFIDMQLMSEDLIASLGPDKSKGIYLWLEPGEYAMYPDGEQDNTHFSEHGATEMARLVAEGIRELGLPLADRLR